MPACVFGDPLQNIFNSGGNTTVGWHTQVTASWPAFAVPIRAWCWEGHNEAPLPVPWVDIDGPVAGMPDAAGGGAVVTGPAGVSRAVASGGLCDGGTGGPVSGLAVSASWLRRLPAARSSD